MSKKPLLSDENTPLKVLICQEDHKERVFISGISFLKTCNKHLAVSKLLTEHLYELGILLRKTSTRTLRHVLINVFFLQSVKLYQFVNF